MTIDHVVLDFDGTCTQVPALEKEYLAAYLEIFQAKMEVDAGALWKPALAGVSAASPERGWRLNGGEPSAPAAADPFILAGEAAFDILKDNFKGPDGKPRTLDGTIHSLADARPKTQWRVEAKAVFASLQDLGVTLHIVSNSSTAKINGHLDELLGTNNRCRDYVKTHGGARKFSITELTHPARVPGWVRRRFNSLPADVTMDDLNRAVKLRRGAFMETLYSVWGDDSTAPERTLFCGDIWELDLAMPAALGFQTHLVTRAPPYATYKYERSAAERLGTVSDDLNGLLERVRSARAPRAPRNPRIVTELTTPQAGEAAMDQPWAGIARLLVERASARRSLRPELTALAPELCEKLVKDARPTGCAELWGRSVNFDEHAWGIIVDPAILRALNEIAGLEGRGLINHAGLTHTYGYLFSLLSTPFGWKRARWIDGQIERGFSLLEGTLGPRPMGGGFLANVTYFIGRIAFRDRPVELALLDRFAAEAAPSLGCLAYDGLSIRRLEEEAKVPAADGQMRVVRLNTDFVALPVQPTSPGESTHLLVYSVVDPDEGGARLITCFPVGADFVESAFKAEVLGASKPIRALYNAHVEGLPGPTPAGSRQPALATPQ